MADVRPRRGRAAIIAIVLLAIAIVVFLVRGEYVARTRIVEANALSDTEIRLSIDSCNGNPSVSEINQDVEDVVRIAVRSTQFIWGGGDCLDQLTFELDEPLGDRRLVDVETGDVVDVTDGTGDG